MGLLNFPLFDVPGGLLSDFTGPKPDYGRREDGTRKGRGFFGELKTPDGRIATELSAGFDMNGRETLAPLIVPGLSQNELVHLLMGKEPSRGILDKAYSNALWRITNGYSPFAD